MQVIDDFEAMIDAKAQEVAERQKRLAKVEIMSGAALMKQDFPEQKFIWDSILPDAGLAVMAASKAAGKTLLLLQLADAISCGRDFLGLPTRMTKVLFLELELSARRTQQRLLKMGIVANDMLHFAHRWTQGDEGLQTIADAVKEHGFGLVIVDVMQLLWPMDADANSYQDVYSVLSPLRQMSNELGVMIVLVTHRRKMDAADYLDGTIGSVGIQANADVIFSIMRTRGEQEVVLHIDGNDIESRKIALRFNVDPLGFTLSNAAPEEIGLSQERREIIEAIRKLGGTARTHDIANNLGMKDDNCSHLLRKLASQGLVKSVGYGQWGVKTPVQSVQTAQSEDAPLNRLNTLNGTSGDIEHTTGTESVRIGKPAVQWHATLQKSDDELGIF